MYYKTHVRKMYKINFYSFIKYLNNIIILYMFYIYLYIHTHYIHSSYHHICNEFT